MKKRKFIGFMTILSGLPGLGGFMLFFIFGFNFSSLGLLAISAILLRGVAGTIGGVLLWRGKEAGYFLSIVCHSYLIIVGSITLYQIFTQGNDISFAFTQENHFFLKMFSKSMGKILWGIPFLYILSKDLLFNKYSIQKA